MQPRYNVLLHVTTRVIRGCASRKNLRIFATRRMVKDGSEYFGPYTSFKTVSTILELIKEL
jgi:excinuclease ABC subunit C